MGTEENNHVRDVDKLVTLAAPADKVKDKNKDNKVKEPVIPVNKSDIFQETAPKDKIGTKAKVTKEDMNKVEKLVITVNKLDIFQETAETLDKNMEDKDKEDKDKVEEPVITVSKLDIFQETVHKVNKDQVERYVITVSKLDIFLLTVRNLSKKGNKIKEENVSDVVKVDMLLMIVKHKFGDRNCF